MRTQIAAANWKMNLNYQQGVKLLEEILSAGIILKDNQRAIFAVPSLYLTMAENIISKEKNYYAAAQNCYQKKSGAFTGEISVEMIRSVSINYCIVGHSERREYFAESNAVLSQKVDLCLENNITPIFCCGEALNVRDEEKQNEFVAKQLNESLFHLTAEQICKIVIAYEPIWAIGTGKTATTEQAQEMHAYLRSVITGHYGSEISNQIPILYGGSVKASNAKEIFSCPDVDGGLVGGASLVAADFIEIIRSLKS